MTKKVSFNVEQERIEQRIYWIRGRKVMFDYDLASLYGVETKQLNRQVKRNRLRFPDDFMFQLTLEEFQRCQIGTFGTSEKGSRKYLPFVFTEQSKLVITVTQVKPNRQCEKVLKKHER